MKYEISEHVVHNIKEFMQRIQLSGAEVPAYVEILNVLNNPLSDENSTKE